jgi:hypothetical protein
MDTFLGPSGFSSASMILNRHADRLSKMRCAQNNQASSQVRTSALGGHDPCLYLSPTRQCLHHLLLIGYIATSLLTSPQIGAFLISTRALGHPLQEFPGTNRKLVGHADL